MVRFKRIERDGVRFLIRRWANETFLYKKIVIEDALLQQQYSFTEKVRLFQAEKFKTMFGEHGLKLTSLYGDYSLQRFKPYQSKRLILVLEKE